MSTKQASAAANDLLRTIICHRTKLVSIANRILHCRQLAEDVVQDAALKACQMGEGPPPDCPLRFSCSVVRNLAIDRARRCALEQRHAAPLLRAEGIAAPLENPQRALENREAMQHVLQVLKEVPARTRLAFLLHRFHDIPQKAIAASLGVSPTLVNFMIRRAQEHCQARLAGAGKPVAQPNRSAATIVTKSGGMRLHAIPTQSRGSGGGSLTVVAQAAAKRYPSGNVHSLT